ncbi:unnamed protein product (macronuclear) [Paramecium tetraurelia]|uniref:Uncharacterized protein n=1 Tax=Paramecium tetraurelia TaxID=5888 RepID=A0BYG5_PARTE|nr:uncharacterized protein GSPATT00033435001 [Paramecium tetraurelia]CAK63582.1 unnamed protein product [Paramecium tetraurelia]|eukprot:XP_001430980.1 hypothetical protein (macronuclear) [Paramecium tetraurelia strain d4-2]
MHMMRTRCNKHKQNYIQFICLQEDCEINKLGCISCFPDHDGHTKQNMEIQHFFEKITQKDRDLELKYLQLINSNSAKKNKEQIIRSIQQQCKAIQSRAFSFIDRHCEALINSVQNKNLNDSTSQLKVKGYHDELERIKNKSTYTLENKEIEFLINFVLTNDYSEMIASAFQIKEKNIQEFTYDINQIVNSIDYQLSELYNQLDSQLSAQQFASSPSFDQKNKSFQHNYSLTLGILPKSPNRNSTKGKSKSPLRQTSTNQSRMKTPESNKKQTYSIGSTSKIQISKFLMTSPLKEEDDFITKNKNLESLITNVLMIHLPFKYLNDHLVFLKNNYVEFQDYNRITQQEKVQIIEESNSQLLYVLWDNLMIEWLKPPLNFSIIQIKVYEVENNFNSFLELFDKQLKMHEFVAYVIKQKIIKPKVDYQTWFILASRATNSFKMYNIKSSGKKVNREMTVEDQSFSCVDQLKAANVYAQFPKVIQDHLNGSFSIDKDLKIIIKGIMDPNFQTQLLAERLQIMLNLVTNPQVAANLTFQNIEKHFDQVLINFKYFINYLNLSLKDTLQN